jgi:4-amino-4-deoxy-L-arabinose transferase-like glycosyltransferase
MRRALDDRLALPVLLLLAAALRLPDLATRGTWDADQGHDMLVLRALVHDGVVPLLGPPTSIGDVHHGAWYYYLLSPAAAVSGGDAPLAVVAAIALAGIVAVGVVWWLARSVGGPLAGLAAGLAMAVSAAAIDESTFIWNPNLIALSSAVALAAAWRAWSGGDERWWLVAGIGTAITMQCHVLGVALLPIVAVPFLADSRRRPLHGVAAGIVVVFLVAYLPLILNEATTGMSETRAALAYLAGGREGTDVTIPVRAGIVGLRVIAWPLTGLITDGFVPGAIAVLAIIGIVVWRRRAARSDGERRLATWFGLGLLWTIGFLAVAAPSLAAVVRGLPNDHYHAFADPIVFVLAGLGMAAIAREVRVPIGPLVAGVTIVALIGWNVLQLPPAVHPDGGYPAADRAAQRVDAALTAAGIGPGQVVLLQSLPDFKSTEAMAYPLARLGRAYHGRVPKSVAPGSVPEPASSSLAYGGLVLLCDDLFRDANGAACGGAAERSVAPETGGGTWGPLLDRFEAAPGRWVSVYAETTGAGG